MQSSRQVAMGTPDPHFSGRMGTGRDNGDPDPRSTSKTVTPGPQKHRGKWGPHPQAIRSANARVQLQFMNGSML